jgi:hypothetical protein
MLPPLPPRVLTCMADNCDEPIGEHGGRGFCPKHYQRLTKRGGDLRDPASTAPDDVRFWVKVDKSAGPDKCWPWLAGINHNGYGVFWLNGKQDLAHRVAYSLAIGEIPSGLHLDHVVDRGCIRRDCVNPAHLEPVTVIVNNQRIVISPAISAKRAAAGRKGAEVRWGSRVEQPE